MRRFFQIELCILGLLSFAAPAAQAGFDFSVFRLRTLSQDRTGPSIVSDVESIDSPQTPVNVLQQTGFGQNTSQTQYDVSYLDYTGTFNAAVNQHIEQPDFITSMERRLTFFADVDLLVTVNIEIEFTSSAADLALIQGFIGIIRPNVGAPATSFIGENFRGGALPFESASGTFSLNQQAILPAGAEYVANFAMSAFSGSVVAPMNAPIEISGFSNLSIMPVPSPATAAMLAVLFPLVLRRSRRPSPTPIQDAPLPNSL